MQNKRKESLLIPLYIDSIWTAFLVIKIHTMIGRDWIAFSIHNIILLKKLYYDSQVH